MLCLYVENPCKDGTKMKEGRDKRKKGRGGGRRRRDMSPAIVLEINPQYSLENECPITMTVIGKDPDAGND